MAQSGQWYNADGLLVKFGEYYKNPANFVNRSRLVQSFGMTRIIEFDVDVTQLAASATSFTTDLTNSGSLTGFNIGDVSLPPAALIKSVTFVVNTPFAGGTSITLGLYQASGSALSATGLMTATEGAIANFNAAGNKIVGAGAYTSTTAGTANWGNHTAYVGLTCQGTFTAGTGRFEIIYLETNIAPVVTA